MKIKEMSYEECREDFFVNLIKHAENKIKYWKRQKGYRCEIDDNLAEAGAEMQYCQDALNALEKHIPKNVIIYGFSPNRMISSISYACPICDKHISRANFCKHCGQALDWSDSE